MRAYLYAGAAAIALLTFGVLYISGKAKDAKIRDLHSEIAETLIQRDAARRDLEQAKNAIKIEEKVIVKTEKIYVHAKELARAIPKPQRCEDIGAMLRAQHDAIVRVRLHYAQISDTGADRDRNPPEAAPALQRP